MNLQSTYTLSNGQGMPMLGFGSWDARGDEAADAVAFALKNGYRLVDTAAYYGNEAQVAAGIHKSGVPREDVFVTSKVWLDDLGYDKTMRAFEASLAQFGFSYLDMYMVHWPVKGLVEGTWKAMEELYANGRVKAIAVSNFPAFLLKEMESYATVMPMVNQVQFHPLYFRGDIYDYCQNHGIIVQAWKPLARGRLFEDEGLAKIAQTHGKTVAQVILRWDLQLGISTIPKSVNEGRILQNADVFNFALSGDEMAYIRSLDRGESTSSIPSGFDVIVEA